MGHRHRHVTIKGFASAMLAALCLNACDAADHTAAKAGNGLRTSYDNMRYRVSDAIYHHEPQNQAPLFVPHASDFCYQVMMDVVCYDRPQPQLHMKLVGVQGDAAASYGYDDYLPATLRGGGAGQSENAQMDDIPANAVALPTVPAENLHGGHIAVSDLGGPAYAAGPRPTPFTRGDASVIPDPYGNGREPAPIPNYSTNNTRSPSAVPAKLMGR